MNRLVTVVVVALVTVSLVGVAVVARLAADPAEPSIADQAAQEATPTPTPTDTPTPMETETGGDLAAVRLTQYEVFISRDPFEPVIVSAPSGEAPDVQPPGSPTTAPTGTPTTSPTGTPTVAPTGTPTPSPTGTPTSSPSPGPSPTAAPTDACVDRGSVVCGGQVVKLIDVFDDGQPGAVVQIDGTAYEVRTNETFASSYEVRSIEAPCATILYGDDAFTLCEGESTLK